MPKQFSEEFKKKIVTLYSEGTSVTSICNKYKISKSSVYNWIKMYTEVKTEGALVYTGREVYLLKKKIVMLEENLDILRQCNCSVNSPIKVKISEIKKLDKKYSYHALSRALGIRRSALYYHLRYRPNETIFEQDDNRMKPIIKETFENSRNRFGSRMVRTKLIEQGITISQERVAKLMKEMGLICNSARQLLPEYKHTYPYCKSANCINKLQRNFNQNHPNSVWVSDITYLRAKSGIYYLCVIIDLFSRMVISYSLSENANTNIVIDTFQQAYNSRHPSKGLMFHSDQGSQYLSSRFKKLLKSLKIEQSFSNTGTPYDNAVAESFFASMKREELYQHIYLDLSELSNAVEEYINFYNNERPHQRLGQKTPSKVEEDYKKS